MQIFVLTIIIFSIGHGISRLIKCAENSSNMKVQKRSNKCLTLWAITT